MNREKGIISMLWWPGRNISRPCPKLTEAQRPWPSGAASGRGREGRQRPESIFRGGQRRGVWNRGREDTSPSRVRPNGVAAPGGLGGAPLNGLSHGRTHSLTDAMESKRNASTAMTEAPRRLIFGLRERVPHVVNCTKIDGKAGLPSGPELMD